MRSELLNLVLDLDPNEVHRAFCSVQAGDTHAALKPRDAKAKGGARNRKACHVRNHRQQVSVLMHALVLHDGGADHSGGGGGGRYYNVW